MDFIASTHHSPPEVGLLMFVSHVLFYRKTYDKVSHSQGIGGLWRSPSLTFSWVLSSMSPITAAEKPLEVWAVPPKSSYACTCVACPCTAHPETPWVTGYWQRAKVSWHLCKKVWGHTWNRSAPPGRSELCPLGVELDVCMKGVDRCPLIERFQVL